ncbi:helix-turn-helix domain-containing protein [Thiorhodococcus mannitoliphagus]|uniref:Helix-turn-helix domain-containing protein n=1 Tax=Thiorhodococcus mannitoliphagus TaxID=329406 RepID=A0A6P1E1W0_9GAMM|nr:helix-turn-helix domain-containing protein [Thiorhodococcus mannitoliphagus]
MSRPLRIELAGGLYHVAARGDRREAIYRDDQDRLDWLTLLGEVCRRFNWRCHAYCEMTNHYHCVVETPDANLSKGMRQLNGVDTQTTNRRHGLVGHLFYPVRAEAIARAYQSGVYRMQEIADDFGVHYSTVSRAVRRLENGIESPVHLPIKPTSA